MPLPTPNEDEKSKDFIDRCMGDETMNSEYPKPAQRSAVCYSQLRRARGEKAAPKKGN